MSKQRFLDITLLILVATLLVAGGGCVSMPTSPATTISPTSPCPLTGGMRVSLATPQPSDVLLELAWEGGLTRPELGFAFGRVPDFSLLPDGSVYYLDPPEWDKAQVMAAHLAPTETEALIQRMLDLGFERLESHTDPCQPQRGGTCLCVADAGESGLAGTPPERRTARDQELLRFCQRSRGAHGYSLAAPGLSASRGDTLCSGEGCDLRKIGCPTF